MSRTREYNAKDRKEWGDPAEDRVADFFLNRDYEVKRHPFYTVKDEGIDWKFWLDDLRIGYAEAEIKKQWKGGRFHFDDVNWMLHKVLKYRGNYMGQGKKTYYFLVNRQMTHVCYATFDKIFDSGRNLGRKNKHDMDLLTTPKNIATVIAI